MVPIDDDLLWIAKEGFYAPLPEGWIEQFIIVLLLFRSHQKCFL